MPRYEVTHHEVVGDFEWLHLYRAAKRVDYAEDVIVIPVTELDERIDRLAGYLAGTKLNDGQRRISRGILDA